MQLRFHFRVTWTKTPNHLVPDLLPVPAGFTKDISGLQKWRDNNPWLKFVCQNLNISWPVFIERKIAPQAFLGKRLLTRHLL
jgi:hypothetical protein